MTSAKLDKFLDQKFKELFPSIKDTKENRNFKLCFKTGMAEGLRTDLEVSPTVIDSWYRDFGPIIIP